MQIFAPLTSEQKPSLQAIEVASSFQLPSFYIIGLPAPEVAEAKERIRAAIESSGLDFPKKRIVVNLSPASIKKRGTGLDLAMALAILSSKESGSHQVAAWGELGLDGSIKSAGQPTRALYAVWDSKISYLFVAEEEFERLRQLENWIVESGIFKRKPPQLVPVTHLEDAWLKLRQIQNEEFSPSLQRSHLKREVDTPKKNPIRESLLPLSPSLERAVAISAAGQHHLLLLGAKGIGKSHALEWLIQLQPDPSSEFKIRRALLSELRNTKEEENDKSPVRRVSSTVKPSALIGSVSNDGIKPGEFSLAHGGLLIADEFPEWPRDSREVLREPLERGKITITRAKGAYEFDARFSFAANGNLCPCGGWPPDLPVPIEIQLSQRKPTRCKCSHQQRTNYKARLSGPLLDRMDIVLLIGNNPPAAKKGQPKVEVLLETLRERVRLSQTHSIKHWGNIPGFLAHRAIEDLILAHPSWEPWLETACQGSLRARHKVARVSLTLTSWDGLDEPTQSHFIEASCFRPEKFGYGD